MFLQNGNRETNAEYQKINKKVKGEVRRKKCITQEKR